MKLLILVSLVTAIVAASCTPSGPSTPAAVQAAAIEAVALVGQDRLVAVGSSGAGSRGGLPSRGVVARTDDGGRHWTASDPNLPDLTFVATAGDRIVASRYCLPPSSAGQSVGPAPSSCLFASDDGGSTWRDLGAGLLVDPTFADASYGWAHTQEGAELDESLDGGLTWARLDSGCPADKPRVFRAVATGLQVGYLICFAIPTEAGQPWALILRSAAGQASVLLEGNSSYGEAHNGLQDEYLRGFSMRPDGVGFIWTSGLYRTTDGGQSWSALTLPTEGLSRGEFWGGGAVIDAELAYLVRRGSTSSIVEYRSGTFTSLIEWPLPF